jgi:hypothetical protein
MRYSAPEYCPYCSSFVAAEEPLKDAEARAGFLLPPTWKLMDRHPQMHCGTWVPSASGDKVVFCEQCHALWYVVSERSSEPPVVKFLGPELSVLLDARGNLDAVWPLLFREEELIRDLVLGYFGGARFDLSAAGRGLVARMGGADLNLQQGERLLQCFCSLLRGEHRSWTTTEEVAVPDLQPLVNLLEREELFRAEREAAPYAKCRMRDVLDDITRLAFASGGRSRRDFLRTEPVFRERLLAIAGAEYRHDQALQQMIAAVVTVEQATKPGAPPEKRIHLDDGVRHLAEALVEVEELMLGSEQPLDGDRLRQIATVTRSLSKAAAAAPSTTSGVDATEREYKDFLQRLLQSRRVPAECLAEVSAALGFHDESLIDLDGGGATATSTLTFGRQSLREHDDEEIAAPPRPPLRVLRTVVYGFVAVALVLVVGAATGSLLAPTGEWRAYAVLAAGLMLVLAGGLRMLRPMVRRAHK